jgi:hypothetical protein
MMIEFQPCTIVFVCGPVRSGKTHLINQWTEKETRMVRFDVTGETMDDPTVMHCWNSPRELYRMLDENPFMFRIAYHPGTELELDFDLCSKVLWRRNVSKTLVCDEFHEVCSVNETPKWVRTILTYARHAKMGLLAASQRIADVHKKFTSGCNMCILFQTNEERDLQAINDRWRCRDLVENLRPLIYDDSTGVTKQVPQCVVIRKGEKPRIYDFKLNDYISTPSLVGELDASRVQEEELETEELSVELSPDSSVTSPDATGDSTERSIPE